MVVIFAVVKFTEGAWLVVIVFPILVFALIRLNREYRMEARVLEDIGERPASRREPPNYTRRTVLVFVDDFDLATLAALRYAREPAAHHAARGALRHRQRAGRPAARSTGCGATAASRWTSSTAPTGG